MSSTSDRRTLEAARAIALMASTPGLSLDEAIDASVSGRHHGQVRARAWLALSRAVTASRDHSASEARGEAEAMLRSRCGRRVR